MSEICIEVDKNDKEIGRRPRTDFYTGQYVHRSVQLVLRNKKGEMLLQKRSPKKIWYPKDWTYSVSGTVAQQTPEQTMQKEAREELNIHLPTRFLFKTFCKHPTNMEFLYLFEAVAPDDLEITFDKEEATEVQWVPLKVIQKDIEENPQKYAYHFVEGMREYFARG